MDAPKSAAARRQEKQDSPYCSFKSDRDRLWALISRDIRLIAVAALIALAGMPTLRTGVGHLWTLFIG